MVKLKDLSDFDKDQIVMLGARTYSASQLVGYGAVQPQTGQGAHADLCPQLKATMGIVSNRTRPQRNGRRWPGLIIMFFFFLSLLHEDGQVCVHHLSGKDKNRDILPKKGKAAEAV